MPDVIIGAKLEADASGAISNVQNFKKELKLAQQEVVILSEKFGATSKEAAVAAKRAAELKDKIQDSRQLIDAFNPDNKFRAFGASIQGVVGGFAALTGAMGLLGIESESVQKTLLKVQSALALSQGIAQLKDSIEQFQKLGTTLVNTLGKSGLIGVAIVGVAALGAALLGVFDKVSTKVREFNASLKELAKGEIEATKEVALMKNAFAQAELKIITKKQALDKYNEGIGKTIGHAKTLNEAETLTKENAAAYIKVQGLKAQANYILGKSAEIAGQAMIDEAELKKKNLGSDPFDFKGVMQDKINERKKGAEDLKLLITGDKGLNALIAEASKGFKAPVDTPTPKTGGKTPAEKAKEEKIKALKEDVEFAAIALAADQENTNKKIAKMNADFELEMFTFDGSAKLKKEKIEAHQAEIDKIRIDGANKSASDLLKVNADNAALALLNDPDNIEKKIAKINADLELESSALKEGDTKKALLAKTAADAIAALKKDALIKENTDLLQTKVDLAATALIDDPDSIVNKLAKMQADFDKETAFMDKKSIAFQNKLLAHKKAMADIEEADDAVKLALRQSQLQAELAAYGSAAGAVADLIGRQTAAGKAFAIAEAMINVYKAAAQVFAAPVIGAPPPVSLGVKIATMVSAIATGIGTVKKIIGVKVPGKGGGGSVPTGSVSAPLIPQLPEATNTRLDQQQLNQVGNATFRAFVLETDVTNNQERIRRLNRSARIG